LSDTSQAQSSKALVGYELESSGGMDIKLHMELAGGFAIQDILSVSAPAGFGTQYADGIEP
jgi:hypothetical protein